MLERWTRAVVRFRTVVLVTWTVVVVLGLFAGARLPGLLTTSLAVPGTGSAKANALLTAHFGHNIEGTFTVVVLFRSATPTQIGRLERQLALAATIRTDASP